MRPFFTFAIAAAFAAGISTIGWAQTGATTGAGSGGSAAGSSGSNVTGAVSGGSATGSTGTGVTGAVPGGSATGAVQGGSPTGAVPSGSTQGQISGNTANIGADARAGVNGRVNPNANAVANPGAINQNFNGISRTPFFSDPNARRQLNLNNAQYSRLNQAYQNAYARYNQGLNNLNPNLTEEQRALQMQQLQAEFNQGLSGSLNSTFTDPNTMSRYNQLNRQFMGYNAFNDPAVRAQLNLTPDQTRQLRTLSNNWRQQLQQFRRGAGNDLSSVDAAQWNQMWQQYGTQLNGVLTPQQQQIWTQQTGSPFVFSPSTYFGNDQTTVGTDQGTAVGINQPTGTDLNAPANIVPKYFPNGGTATQGTQPQAVPRQANQQGTAPPSTSNGTTR